MGIHDRDVVYFNNHYDIHLEPSGSYWIEFGSEYSSDPADMCGVINFLLHTGRVKLSKLPGARPLLVVVEPGA